MIYNFLSLLSLLDRAKNRTPSRFTESEHAHIAHMCHTSPLFLEWVHRFAPPPFPKLWRIAQQRGIDVTRGRLNVHDPIYSESRAITKEWLYDTIDPQKKVATVKNCWHSVRNTLLQWANTSGLDTNELSILQKYIPFFIEQYTQGATGFYHLQLILQWIDSEESSEEKTLKISMLFDTLLDSAKAYEHEIKKFYEGLDYSCMPGLDERLLDMMTGVRLSLEPSRSLHQQSTQAQYIALAYDSFLRRDAVGMQPSALFYALYIHTIFPDGFVEEKTPALQIILRSKKSSAYAHATTRFTKKKLIEIQEYFESNNTAWKRQRLGAIRSYLDEVHHPQDGSITFERKSSEQIFAQAAKEFSRLYDLYHELILPQDILDPSDRDNSHSEFCLPRGLSGLLLNKKPTFTSSIVCADGGRSRLHQKRTNCSEIFSIIQNDTDFEIDFLISVCILSGGLFSAQKFFDALEIKREHGHRVEPEWINPAIVYMELKKNLYRLSCLHVNLSITDRTLSVVYSQWKREFLLDYNITNLENIIITSSVRQIIQHQHLLEYPVYVAVVFRATEQGLTTLIQSLLGHLPHSKWRNLKDVHGDKRGLLEKSIFYNQPSSLNILLDLGGNIDTCNRNGQSLLQMACLEGNLPIMQILHRRGASINIRDYLGIHCLHIAASRGDLHIVQWILAQHVYIDYINRRQNTALYCALSKSQINVAIYLIQKGANFYRKNLERDSAFNVAKSLKMHSVFEAMYLQRPSLRLFSLCFQAHVRQLPYYGITHPVSTYREYRVALHDKRTEHIQAIKLAIENQDIATLNEHSPACIEEASALILQEQRSREQSLNVRPLDPSIHRFPLIFSCIKGPRLTSQTHPEMICPTAPSPRIFPL